MSYLGPVRFFFKGDKKLAARYIGDARRFIAQLQAQLGVGVTSGRRRKILKDGVIIEVVVAGGTIAATIITKGGGRKTRWFEDFVIFSGAQASDGAGGFTYYPVILKYMEDAESWIPYFWKSSVQGYDIAPSPKGTYFDVWPKPYDLSKGIQLWGWPVQHINAAGEAVNWVGLQADRYHWFPYRQPYNMFNAVVYHMGRALFQSVDYEAERGVTLGPRNVMAAAIRDGYLYVLFGGYELGISYSVPATPTIRRSAWASPVYPNFPQDYALRRFPIHPVKDPQNGLVRYELSAGPMETLWEGTLTRACNPWMFNAEVTKLVTYTLAAQCVEVFAIPTPAPVPPEDGPPPPLFRFETDGTPQTTLSTSHSRVELTIDADFAAATLDVSTATTAIAEENGHVWHIVKTGASTYKYELDGVQYPCLEISDGYKRTRSVHYADITNHWFLFQEVEIEITTSPSQVSTTRRAILCRNGEETELDSATIVEPLDLSAAYTAIEGDRVLKEWFTGLNASAMAIYNLQIFGSVYEDWVLYDNPAADPPEESYVAADFSTHLPGAWPALREIMAPLGEKVSFGGAKLNTSAWETDDEWMQWDFVRGYDGSNDPASYVAPVPSFYYTNTGGCSLADPDRVVISARLVWGSRPPMNVAFLTNGDLAEITGQTVGTPDTLALSVTILGKPPTGQTVDY